MLSGVDLGLRDKVFIGFIIAASLAMIGGVYGTYRANLSVILASIVFGLAATLVGWAWIHHGSQKGRLEMSHRMVSDARGIGVA